MGCFHWLNKEGGADNLAPGVAESPRCWGVRNGARAVWGLCTRGLQRKTGRVLRKVGRLGFEKGLCIVV